MNHRTCFFIGHRDTPIEIKDLLYEAIERHITEYGVTDFYVGHYGNFDHMAAKSVMKAKEYHQNICLYMLLPYHPAEYPILIPVGFDGSYYPFEKPVPRKFAIIRANLHMIDNSDFLIAYAKYPGGKARDFTEYAQRREKRDLIRVENLAFPSAR